jgi:1,4-dihydroxy-2-naphthoate octaprenyltransferase
MPTVPSPWIAATRPKTLAAGAAPVAVGTALAGVPVRWDLAAACLGGALALQIACNFANEVGDAQRGADAPGRLGPARAVAAGTITPRAMLAATVTVLVVALGLGLYLAAHSGWPILVVGALGIVAALAYTLGPMPLAYVGLGDVFVLLFFGFAAVVGSAWVQAPQVPPAAWWLAGTAIGLQATALLAINNLRDIATDAPVGKRTLCVRLGDRASRVYHALLHAAAGAVLLAAGFAGPAVVAWIGGTVLAALVWRWQGRQLNRGLGLAALVQVLTAATLVLASRP